ncbi:MAG: oxygen-independent coproporphyrinogen oxidase [Firmicutes bacterium]|nr:oxygen-independent coproporphyrinogen oxidase [Bacillota bacterium]
MKLGVYIHIPFCRKKCLYCDFSSSARDVGRYYLSYTAALCREITGRGGVLSEYTVDTIYFGGGTPTLFPADAFATMIERLKDCCAIENDAEITVEANPDTVNEDKLAALRGIGVNRISFGVQSFDDGVLKAAGRIHSSRAAKIAILTANKCGFDNISLDLMYGLPEQSLASFGESLREALALPVHHLSVYGLKVEAATPFGEWLAAGRLALPDEDEEDAMYSEVVKFLPEQGYHRYEISNYALTGYESRHNLKYWRYQPYLGLGAAAHSFLKGRRFANTKNIDEYSAMLGQGQLPTNEEELLSIQNAMAEYVFLALRTADGLEYIGFKERFGIDFIGRYGEVVKEMTAKGALSQDKRGIRLTSVGMKYGNVVFAAFLPE